MNNSFRTHRAPIYSHFDGQGNDIFQCRHCRSRARSSGGSSNLHKHMKASHPLVDRNQFYDDEHSQEHYESTTNGGEPVEKKRLKVNVKPKVPPLVHIESHSVILPEHHEGEAEEQQHAVDEEEAELFVITDQATSEVAGPVNQPPAPSLTPTLKLLRRLKHIHNEQAELQNELLEQQFESQNQLAMIHELQRQVKELKKGSVQIQVEDSREDGGLKFPLCRMSELEVMEERIKTDPQFKAALSKVFQQGQYQKVISIQSWFSNELLVQFSHKTDRDTLTTHRSTELSEVFQLMYSSWYTAGFTKKDFTNVIKAALEGAYCQLSSGNSQWNRTKTKAKMAAAAKEDEYFEEEGDIHEEITVEDVV